MGQAYSYAIDLVAQTSKFERNVENATSKITNLTRQTQRASGEIVNMSKLGHESFGKMGEGAERVMGSLGSAIGGIKGEVIVLCGELAVAMGPIALITAGIGGIAMAWKVSEENVKSYLERVEKGDKDPAIFNRDSKEAIKGAKKAAQGGIDEGLRLQADANQKLMSFGAKYSEEQKKHLVNQRALGEEMVNEGRLAQKNLGYQYGILTSRKARLGAEQTSSELLSANDELEKDKIRTSTEVNNLEAELLTIKTKIMSQEGTIAERKKLEEEYTDKAGVIATKKLVMVARELEVKGELLRISLKTEELEKLQLNTENSRAEINRALEQDLFNTVRLMNAINKAQGKIERSVAEQLRDQKDLNMATEKGYKLGQEGTNYSGDQFAVERAGYANTKQLTKASMLNAGLVKPEGADNLRDYKGKTQEEIDAAIKMNRELENQARYVENLEAAYANMNETLANGGESWNEYAANVKNSIREIIAAHLAKSVANMVSNAIEAAGLTGPLALVVAPALIAAGAGIAKTAFNSIVPKFAEGALAYGPTIGMMGEYSGARNNPEVIAPLNKLKDMIQPAMTGGNVVFRIGNRELIGVLEHEQRVGRNIRGRG